MTTRTAPAAHDLLADRLMLGLTWGLFLLSAVIGQITYTLDTALHFGLPIAIGATVIWRIAPGSRLSRYIFATTSMALASLQIDQARGMVELHFGIFVLLAFLLIYRDWRPIVVAAAVIAVQHMLFGYLQSIGAGVYCFTQPSIGILLIHATYVVVESAVLVFIAVALRAQALQDEELRSMVSHIDSGQGTIDLTSRGTQVRSPTAQIFEQSLDRIRETLSSAMRSADVVTAVASALSRGNSNLAQAESTQTATLNRAVGVITDAASTMSAHAEFAADAQRNARKIVDSAADAAQDAASSLERLNAVMKNITASAARITEINDVINAIAFQTNILALNAAVEAARAGDHGRGFAVVAAEVRSLAQRSASSAQDVAAQVADAVKHMKDGGSLTSQVSSTMKEVIAAFGAARNAMHEVMSGSEQHGQKIQHMHAAVGDIENVVRHSASLIAEHETTAKTLDAQAASLSGSLNAFRLV